MILSTQENDLAKRVTIKSIAEDLGISHMTVSRALSGNPNVSSQTRILIENRARDLGYVKSAAAKAMRGDGTKIVGLLLPNITNDFYARYANAFAKECDRNGLHLVIHLTDDEIEKERVSIRQLREIQAMAVVMVPCAHGVARQDRNIEGLNVIQLVRSREMTSNSISLVINDAEAIHDAVVHLRTLGFDRIGYIGADPSLSTGRDRFQSYHNGLTSVGLELDANLVIRGAPNFDLGFSGVPRLLEGQGATALICGGVEISNGAISALMQRHDGSGDTFGFVGYGDPAFLSWIGKGLPGIQLPIEELAAITIQQIGAFNGEARDVPPATHALKAELAGRVGKITFT